MKKPGLTLNQSPALISVPCVMKKLLRPNTTGKANNPNTFGGFTKIPNKVIWSDLLTQHEKLVLIAIMSFNPRFPSYAVLMKITGIKYKNNISKALKGLVAKNIIRYIKGGSQSGKANEYKVYWDEDFELL